MMLISRSFRRTACAYGSSRPSVINSVAVVAQLQQDLLGALTERWGGKANLVRIEGDVQGGRGVLSVDEVVSSDRPAEVVAELVLHHTDNCQQRVHDGTSPEATLTTEDTDFR
jgi:hypothetical protein